VSGWLRLAAFVSLVLLGTVAVAGPSGSGYHLVKSVPIGAAPGESEYFDYVTVDPGGRRVYIAHGSEVKVPGSFPHGERKPPLLASTV
jgi:hypothetical protein